jgi:hypothetical protein
MVRSTALSRISHNRHSPPSLAQISETLRQFLAETISFPSTTMTARYQYFALVAFVLTALV